MKANKNLMKKELRKALGKNNVNYLWFCEMAMGLPNEQLYGMFLDLMKGGNK